MHVSEAACPSQVTYNSMHGVIVIYCYGSVLQGHSRGKHYFAPNGGQPSILCVSQNVSVIIFRLKLLQIIKVREMLSDVRGKIENSFFHCFYLRDEKRA